MKLRARAIEVKARFEELITDSESFTKSELRGL